MTSRPMYARVPQTELTDSQRKAYDDHEERKKKRAERMERINNKIHAVMWVVAAGFTIYHTDFFRVLAESKEINRWVNPCMLSRI